MSPECLVSKCGFLWVTRVKLMCCGRSLADLERNALAHTQMDTHTFTLKQLRGICIICKHMDVIQRAVWWSFSEPATFPLWGFPLAWKALLEQSASVRVLVVGMTDTGWCLSLTTHSAIQFEVVNTFFIIRFLILSIKGQKNSSYKKLVQPSICSWMKWTESNKNETIKMRVIKERCVGIRR